LSTLGDAEDAWRVDLSASEDGDAALEADDDARVGGGDVGVGVARRHQHHRVGQLRVRRYLGSRSVLGLVLLEPVKRRVGFVISFFLVTSLPFLKLIFHCLQMQPRGMGLSFSAAIKLIKHRSTANSVRNTWVAVLNRVCYNSKQKHETFHRE